MTDLLQQQQLQRVQQRMKSQADKNRSERSFEKKGYGMAQTTTVCADLGGLQIKSEVAFQIFWPL